MNNGLFTKWFTDKLLPHLPQHALILMDNAPSHTTFSPHSAPLPTCHTERISVWLSKNGVPVTEACLTAEMIEILTNMAPAPTYALDALAAAHGHDILRTPPYHPELHPIETCWAVVQNHIARQAKFTMAQLLEQLDDAFDQVTATTCAGLIKIVQHIEDNFWMEDVQSDAQN
jgi:hypothetical protein